MFRDRLRHSAFHICAVRHTCQVRGVTRVRNHCLEPEGARQALPEAVVTAGDKYPQLVGAEKIAIRHQ